MEKKYLEKKFWHPMSPVKINEKDALIIERGQGSWVFDSTGKKLLDGVAGLWCVNIGHNRSEIKQAITKQMDQLEYFQIFSGISHPKAYELADKLIEMMRPEEMEKVFYSSGGSDAVETALKISRQYWRAVGKPSKIKFMSLTYSYHGVHYGGVSIGGNNIYFQEYGPVLSECIKLDSPWTANNPWNCTDEKQLVKLAIQQMETKINFYGADTIAAFIAEPIQGAGGVIVPPETYWKEVRKICDKYDILLIADEVVTGFGRSGSMFGSRGWGVKPDIMVLAKGLTSGYIPMGVTAFNRKVVSAIESKDSLSKVMMHGYTYSGHPLACAAALAALDIVEKENIPENAKKIGTYLIEKLKEMFNDNSGVASVRGKGLMIAIDFSDNTKSNEEVNTFVTKITEKAFEEGVIIRPLGDKIIISPPLTLTMREAEKLLTSIKKGINTI